MRLIIESPAPDVNESLSYYKDVGFQCTNWRKAYLCQVKNLTIFLNPDPYSRPCINLFGAQEEKTTVSPSGTWIKERKENIKYSTPDTKGLLGNYAGVCVETLDLEASFVFWQAKGFKGKLNHNASWCQLENKNGDRLSLLKANSCPHLFTNPSLAFFNGPENSTIIQKIRALRLPIKQEVIFGEESSAENLILNDPEGLSFFIFND